MYLLRCRSIASEICKRSQRNLQILSYYLTRKVSKASKSSLISKVPCHNILTFPCTLLRDVLLYKQSCNHGIEEIRAHSSTRVNNNKKVFHTYVSGKLTLFQENRVHRAENQCRFSALLRYNTSWALCCTTGIQSCGDTSAASMATVPAPGHMSCPLCMHVPHTVSTYK